MEQALNLCQRAQRNALILDCCARAQLLSARLHGGTVVANAMQILRTSPSALVAVVDISWELSREWSCSVLLLVPIATGVPWQVLELLI